MCRDDAGPEGVRISGDFRHLAESLHCVAKIDDPAVANLVNDIAPWMPNLRTCDTRAAFEDAVSAFRPDIAIVGERFSGGDLDALDPRVLKAGMGLAVVHARTDEVPLVMPDGDAARQVDIEPIFAGAGATDTVLRLRSQLRRCRPLALIERHVIGDLTLDEETFTVKLGTRVAPLALADMKIIAPMFELPDHVWRREELLFLVYGSMTTNSLRTLEVKLNATRRKLRAALGRDPIRTVRGIGYMLATHA